MCESYLERRIMKIVILFQQYIYPGDEAPPWTRRWKRRAVLLLAFITPGFPQVLSKHRLLRGGILFFLGTGVLISLAIGLFFSYGPNVWRAFDLHYFIVMPDLSSAYPMHLASFVETSDKVMPIHPPGEVFLVYTYFWELLYVFITLYVGCAVISVWDQWKSRRS